jgi:hypothetical protein
MDFFYSVHGDRKSKKFRGFFGFHDRELEKPIHIAFSQRHPRSYLQCMLYHELMKKCSLTTMFISN